MVNTKYRTNRYGKRSIRSAMMRHVLGFICVALYFVCVLILGNRFFAIADNVTLFLLILGAFFTYGFGYIIYDPFRKAWLNSAN